LERKVRVVESFADYDMRNLDMKLTDGGVMSVMGA
jgi:hypothetical protein